MLYFDFMEKKTVHMLASIFPSFKKNLEATGTDWLFHWAVAKQQGASVLKASDTWSSNCHQLEH